MPGVQPVTLEATQEDLLLQAQIFPRRPLLTSHKLGWEGIHVQHHQQPGWEIPKTYYDQHLLFSRKMLPLLVKVFRSFSGLLCAVNQQLNLD